VLLLEKEKIVRIISLHETTLALNSDEERGKNPIHEGRELGATNQEDKGINLP